jgi:malonate transporter and related proteins
MINFFLLSLPIFAVIGVGWAATRTRLVAQGALDALNAFSFRFALPALLLRLIAGQPLRQSFNPEFYTGYLASGAIIFVLVLGTSRIVAARSLSTAGVHATTATVIPRFGCEKAFTAMADGVRNRRSAAQAMDRA